MCGVGRQRTPVSAAAAGAAKPCTSQHATLRGCVLAVHHVGGRRINNSISHPMISPNLSGIGSTGRPESNPTRSFNKFIALVGSEAMSAIFLKVPSKSGSKAEAHVHKSDGTIRDHK